MKRKSIKLMFSITNWYIWLLAFMVYSCSPKQVQILKSEPILTWMKNENVPTVGVCIIENSKIQEVKMFGNIVRYSPIFGQKIAVYKVKNGSKK